MAERGGGRRLVEGAHHHLGRLSFAIRAIDRARQLLVLPREVGRATGVKQLQGAAQRSHDKIDAQYRRIIAAMANDAAGDGHGPWVVACDPVEGDYTRAGPGGTCWLHGSALTVAAEMLPEAAKNDFDREALPSTLRCLAGASFDAFQRALLDIEPTKHNGGKGHALPGSRIPNLG